MSGLGRTGGFDDRGLGFSPAFYLPSNKERTNHISKVITGSDQLYMCICIISTHINHFALLAKRTEKPWLPGSNKLF